MGEPAGASLSKLAIERAEGDPFGLQLPPAKTEETCRGYLGAQPPA
jgi:hypothetical protein